MKKSVFILLLIICAASLFAGEPAVVNVIYIGNSAITFQQMHRTIEEITAREGFTGPGLTAHPLCRGGASYGYHLSNVKAVQELIKRKDCTIAVISGTLIFDKQDAVDLIHSLQQEGLKVFIYMQAASRTQSREVQRRHNIDYLQLAEETGATLVPLGTAVWDVLSETDQNYDFFAFDKSHASKKASYLGACMIVNLITGRPVVPPPADYDFTYEGLNREDELFLRETAAQYTLDQ